MLEEAPSVPGRDRRDRRPHLLNERLAGARLRLAQQRLDLRERLPTFICVVQTHILDDARGAEDGSRTPAAQWLSRNSPSAPMETPTANRDRREEVAT